MKKSGQVTIFVIVAVIFVAIVLLFFLFKTGKIPSIIGGTEKDPQVFLENCLEPKIQEAVNLLEKQGGKIKPQLAKNFKFNDDKEFVNISFLCYTSKNYLPCINREPVLINSLEEEINSYISEEIENCFSKWKEGMKRAGYSVEMDGLNYDIELEPKQIILNAERKISASTKEENFQYNEFRIVLRSKIYDLAIVVQEILSQEAEYCNFDIQGFMLLYPEFDIDKFRTSDLNTIYTVQDRKSQEKIRFAVRGCVIPAGI